MGEYPILEDEGEEYHTQEEEYPTVAAPTDLSLERYPTVMATSDSKREDESLDAWMKYHDNMNKLQEYGVHFGEDDPEEMFNNLEKNWNLISQPGVKIIPIPRIG